MLNNNYERYVFIFIMCICITLNTLLVGWNIQVKFKEQRKEINAIKQEMLYIKNEYDKLLEEVKKIKEEQEKWKKIGDDYRATAYWIGEDSYGYQTATGIRSRAYETCAVDPDVIPLGSEIKVVLNDGETHILQAVDVGGAVKGKVVDIFTETPRYECWDGVEVYINTEI